VLKFVQWICLPCMFTRYKAHILLYKLAHCKSNLQTIVNALMTILNYLFLYGSLLLNCPRRQLVHSSPSLICTAVHHVDAHRPLDGVKNGSGAHKVQMFQISSLYLRLSRKITIMLQVHNLKHAKKTIFSCRNSRRSRRLSK